MDRVGERVPEDGRSSGEVQDTNTGGSDEEAREEEVIGKSEESSLVIQ